MKIAVKMEYICIKDRDGPHGCATIQKEVNFWYHHFFSLVKQWQCRLVHGQKMREVVQLVAFFG